ncbi:dihydroorotate dehydrogenase electron transfer subunit [Chloroflexota bacterium]
MQQVVTHVISNKEIMAGGYLVWLDCPQIASVAVPGQFVMVLCRGQGADVPLLRRPLSIHRVDGDRLALLYAVVGQGTQWLADRKTGDQVDILGPLGNNFTIDVNSKRLLLVAGGIGIAPTVALADYALDRGYITTLLIGCRSAEHMYSEGLLDRAVSMGLNVVVVTEDGSKGRKGMVTEALAELAPAADQIYACGPLPMYRAINRDLNILGGKQTQVCLEQMMGCGWGVCYGCTIETSAGLKKVCQDGPVFDIGAVVWNSVVEPIAGRA